MAEKRYYWLKLKEDYFNSPKIKKLRKIAGGDTYTIIYLKMQLLSIKNNGIIEFEKIEPTFQEELALKLDEDVENVSVTFEEIRQSLNINKPNLSKIIKDLENKKLIKTITYKRGCILYKKIRIVQDMTKYDEDFIKEAEAECRRLVMDGVTTLELGNKIVSMKDVCLKVCGESFNEIRGTKNSKTDRVGKTNKVDKADKKVKGSKGKTGIVGITNEVQSVEDFEDGNEEAESKKVETKPKQEVYDDAYYEELFNSVEF